MHFHVLQAYREWQRNTSADDLFIINNDVLVPDGVIDAMAAALTPEGEPAGTHAMVHL